jgi:methylated-DNA-protein-cysteine methyltransferase-like protein
MPHAVLPSAFAERVYRVVQDIPRGRVVTYGQIAGMIPPPPGSDLRAWERVKARWVGYAMASCPDELPWQRVVNSRGGISLRGGEGPELQRLLLADEGVVFEETGRIDLARYRWEPEPEWYAAHPEYLPPSTYPGSARKTGRRS